MGNLIIRKPLNKLLTVYIFITGILSFGSIAFFNAIMYDLVYDLASGYVQKPHEVIMSCILVTVVLVLNVAFLVFLGFAAMNVIGG